MNGRYPGGGGMMTLQETWDLCLARFPNGPFGVSISYHNDACFATIYKNLPDFRILAFASASDVRSALASAIDSATKNLAMDRGYNDINEGMI